jgi:hypothetical protein
MDPLRLNKELPRWIARESPGYKYCWLEMTVSSTVRVWCDDTREARRETPDLYEEEDASDLKSEMDGRELRGGTKTVEREPVLELLAVLSSDMIVRMEPVIEGERATEDDSGRAIGRLTASLLRT